MVLALKPQYLNSAKNEHFRQLNCPAAHTPHSGNWSDLLWLTAQTVAFGITQLLDTSTESDLGLFPAAPHTHPAGGMLRYDQ